MNSGIPVKKKKTATRRSGGRAAQARVSETANEAAVTLSKDTIRRRILRFAATYANARSEQSERQSFWNDLFACFGIDRRQVASFEQLAKRSSTGGRGWIDLLYPGQMAVEHKSAGEDLEAAMQQLHDYLPGLTRAQHPWLLVACDFQTFKWQNLNTREEGTFELAHLVDHLDLFFWIAGYGVPHEQFENDEQANLRATELLASIHDHLSANGYEGHELREWMTRILFCLFADDTGIWDRAAFHAYVALRTKPDGTDLGPAIAHLFQVLNVKPEKRPKNLDPDLAQYTYINGDIFGEILPIAPCDAEVREALLEACRFEWAAISPAIFGSMFQNVMAPAERRQLGAHYTTEANILRTIRPLFLDELEAKLAAAESKPKLRDFLNRLARLTFFDPACGCGNFLVIAYREIRRLETEALRRLRDREKRSGQLSIDVTIDCKVRVDQFYGIEIEEFPARIARAALYLADHVENRNVSALFGQHYARFPIPASPHIIVANALRIDWGSVLPPDRASYVFGNPPFVGIAWMSPDQQEDRNRTFALLDAADLRTGRLDYVASWYAKAILYAKDHPIRIAFVSTNSLTQGEQARSMGPLLARYGYHIDFAHRTFHWSSEARGKANVHVVVVGFSKHDAGSRQLFDYPDPRGEPVETSARNINIWLADAPDVTLVKRATPLRPGYPIGTKGSQPTDGNHLIVEPEDYAAVMAEPIASRYVRRYVQARDFLRGQARWCLWLVDASPADLRSSPILKSRLDAVRRVRLTSRTRSVREQADTPARFTQIRQPSVRYLALPEVSSENRRFIPAAFLEPDVIAGNKLITFPGADLFLFGMLQSSMFMAWVRAVAGRMKSDISISPHLTYCTFPFPEASAEERRRLEIAADGVLQVRARHARESLDDLYDPIAMPSDLLEAHHALDRIVDALFVPRRRFRTDADRLAVLFERYGEIAPDAASDEIPEDEDDPSQN